MHPLGRRGRPLGLGDDHAEHPQRPDEQHDVDVERHQRAEAEAAVEHLVAAVAEHEDQADVGQQLHGRQVAGPDPGRRHRRRRRRRRPRARRRSACTCSAPKPLTTRTPLTVSSTTEASSADSRWMAMTGGCSRVEKRLPSKFRNGQRAERQDGQHGVDQGQDHRRPRPRSRSWRWSAGSAPRRPGSAAGRCWPGSSAHRSAPRSWKAKWSRWRWANRRSRRTASAQRLSLKAQ